MGVLLYAICHFSLATFNILSVFNFSQFDYCMSQCVPQWIILLESLCSSWTWLNLPFPMLGNFSAIISSGIVLRPLSLSPSETCIM